MRHESSLGWLGTPMTWNSEGVPPITFLPSGGNGTSSSTSIPLQAYPNRDAVHAATPTISLIPALYLLVGPGTPLPNPTCATTLTKADPAPRTPCPYQHRCNQPGCSAAHSGEEHAKLTRHKEDRPKSSSSSGNSSRGHS